MSLAGADVSAITITLQLAAITTLLLMLIATPLAWWLTHTHARWRAAATALVSLPLVLPPTVLGFYLLVLLGPQGTVGRMMQHFGLATLPFTFGGLVVGSVVFSLPFAVQPIANAFAAIGARPLEAAATLRASPWDRFWSVAVPLARPGFMTAAVLAFAHTVGEFGVVLMLGGNIPGVTRGDRAVRRVGFGQDHPAAADCGADPRAGFADRQRGSLAGCAALRPAPSPRPRLCVPGSQPVSASVGARQPGIWLEAGAASGTHHPVGRGHRMARTGAIDRAAATPAVGWAAPARGDRPRPAVEPAPAADGRAAGGARRQRACGHPAVSGSVASRAGDPAAVCQSCGG